MSRVSEFSKNPEVQDGGVRREPKAKGDIKGLQALRGVEALSPKDLWADDGIPFPRPLLKVFKKSAGACSLIQETGKE